MVEAGARRTEDFQVIINAVQSNDVINDERIHARRSDAVIQL